MFVGDSWYVAAWSDEVKGDLPFGRRLCGQPLVLFRESNGRVAALYDSCCHRGAPLTAGRVIGKGLQCGYHGLVFAPDGRCVEIPGQKLIPAKVRVRSYPVVEKNQLIWVWMGDPSKADAGSILDYPFHDDPKWPHRHAVTHVNADYLLLIDNLMDLTHLAYVHPTNVGGVAGPIINAEMDVQQTPRGVAVKRWMPQCPPPPTYRKSVALPDCVDRWQEFEYLAPSAVLQWNGAVPAGRGARDPMNREGGFSFRLLHLVSPETESSCHYFWSAAHGHRATEPAATQILIDEVSSAMEEDKRIVESQFNRLRDAGDSWLVDIRSDAARIAMRRVLNRLMQASGPVAAGPVS
jgi:vanillate O-demethylase monooxygenase subunit